MSAPIPSETTSNLNHVDQILPSEESVTQSHETSQATEPASPSTTSDSKRSDAAYLARELASSSRWSDAFMPQSYGTIASVRDRADGLTTSTQAQEDRVIQNNTLMTQDEFDPPPAYSNLPEVHELPAEPVTSTTAVASEASEQIPTRPETTDAEQGHADEHEEPDAESPLISRERYSHPSRSWTPWIRKGKTPARRCARLLCLVIAFSVVAGLIMCLVFKDSAEEITTPARVHIHHEAVGDIRGSYKLYDRLELSVATGSIDVTIDPQPGDGPAYLFLASNVGTIVLRLDQKFMRRRQKFTRPIYTEIHSLSGSVVADIMLGNGGVALVDSGIGSQDLSFHTYKVGYNDPVSNITTYSQTGPQKVTLGPMDSSRNAITAVNAEHHGFLAASLDINYPPSWFGEVQLHAEPLGRFKLNCDKMQLTEEVENEIIAHRGSLKGKHRVQVISNGAGEASFSC